MTMLSVILVVLTVLKTTDAFTTAPKTSVSKTPTIQKKHTLLSKNRQTTKTATATTKICATGNSDNNDNIDFSDLPPEESTEYTGSIDWDAEWKKVVASEGKVKTERPGKDFYKSEAEIAAIKAANKANEQISSVGSTVSNSLPDIRSLSGDWRFWIAILALVSVGLSVLTAPQPIPTGLQGDSYYI
jgi:hypothetical protein